MDGYQDNLAQILNEVTLASSGFNDPGGTEIVDVSGSDNSCNEEQEMAIHCWVCWTSFAFWKHYQKHIRENKP